MLPQPKPRASFLKGATLAPLLNAKGRATFKVTAPPTVGKYGLDVPGNIGKSAFILTMDTDGSNFYLCVEAFGRKEDDWVGGTLSLGTKVSEKTGNHYVIVHDAG